MNVPAHHPNTWMLSTLQVYYWLWKSRGSLFSACCCGCSHWLVLVYEALLGLLSSYLRVYMCNNQHGLRIHSIIQMIALGIGQNQDFKCAAGVSRNNQIDTSVLVCTGCLVTCCVCCTFAGVVGMRAWMNKSIRHLMFTLMVSLKDGVLIGDQ